MYKATPVFLLLALGGLLMAQSAPSASRGGGGLWAGAEFSDFNPDYSCSTNMPLACGHDLLGMGAIADLDLGRKLGVRGEARWLPWNGASGETESSYLIGPRYRLWSRSALSLSGNFLVGVGRISAPELTATDFAYAPGADLAYRYSPRISLFLDYQYQFWPSFAGPPTVSGNGQVTLHNHGLSPNGFSWGAKYRIF